MSKFLPDDNNKDDYNDDAKAIAIPPVFSENSQANKGLSGKGLTSGKKVILTVSFLYMYKQMVCETYCS